MWRQEEEIKKEIKRANEQYMWATRMSHAPNMPTTETHFYQQAIIHLDASAATGDRLMDCIRAAFLLSAFQYMNGRHHSVSSLILLFFFHIFGRPNHFFEIELMNRDIYYVDIQLSKSPFLMHGKRIWANDRLVKSCGLHRISSTVFSPAPPFNPFLRNRPYLLPPPEDALELAERIHTLYVFLFSLFPHEPLSYPIIP